MVFVMLFPGVEKRPKPNAMCTLPVDTTAIAEIATIALNVLWFFILFNFYRHFSIGTMLYLR